MDAEEKEKISSFMNDPQMTKLAKQKHCDEMRKSYLESLQVADDYKKNGEPALELEARKAAEKIRRQIEEECEGKAE